MKLNQAKPATSDFRHAKQESSYNFRPPEAPANGTRKAPKRMGRVITKLGRECRNARQHAEVLAIEVAQAAGTSQAAISRFENGTWPKDVERVVRAYEKLCGLERHELWRRAIYRS